MAQQENHNNSEMATQQQDASYYQQTPNMHEPDHTIAQSQTYPQNDYIQHTLPHNNVIIQDPYAGQAMYYNQCFNGIATSWDYSSSNLEGSWDNWKWLDFECGVKYWANTGGVWLKWIAGNKTT